MKKITVTELSRRADISKTTFYYHYDDIYAVAEEFENELIEQLSAVLSEISRGSLSDTFDFGYYTRSIIDFLKENEAGYKMVMGASSPQLFIEKLKKIIAKKITENISYVPFDSEPEKWEVQICFFTSACVDVAAEYFRGGFSVPFDTVTEVVLEAVEKLKPKKTPSAD